MLLPKAGIHTLNLHPFSSIYTLTMPAAKALLIQFVLVSTALASSGNKDRFNYRETEGTDYGPADWDSVRCSDLGECLGWPDGWELGVGWSLDHNNCEWCPATGNNCGEHRQSPIDLERSFAMTGHDPECYDFHWIVSMNRSN